jgi:sRNA-binding protein
MNDERRADAVIAAFARLWPKCFFVAPEDRQPLMTGIHHHVRKHLQPMIDVQRISARDIELALSRYTAARHISATSRPTPARCVSACSGKNADA